MFRMLASTSSVAVITVVVALYCYLVTRVRLCQFTFMVILGNTFTRKKQIQPTLAEIVKTKYWGNHQYHLY